MDEPVTLTIAPDGRYARVARTAVAACASLVGFSLDDLTDVRLLTDMAFHVLAELGQGPIDICISAEPGAVRIEMSARRAGTRGWDDPEVQMLDSVTAVVSEERQFVETDGRLVLRVAVRARGEATE